MGPKTSLPSLILKGHCATCWCASALLPQRVRQKPQNSEPQPWPAKSSQLRAKHASKSTNAFPQRGHLSVKISSTMCVRTRSASRSASGIAASRSLSAASRSTTSLSAAACTYCSLACLYCTYTSGVQCLASACSSYSAPQRNPQHRTLSRAPSASTRTLPSIHPAQVKWLSAPPPPPQRRPPRKGKGSIHTTQSMPGSSAAATAGATAS
mmetsp:Transcript_34569/g.76236  ORF Transcript_34569/g.76236 Transcript_34569/m.76236 type:complete len:210 (+) Transcript_34569:444-1073(+)